jgi:hypothetical protein
MSDLIEGYVVLARMTKKRAWKAQSRLFTRRSDALKWAKRNFSPSTEIVLAHICAEPRHVSTIPDELQ